MARRKRRGEPVHGWLVLDKPYDMTSTAALGAAKRLFNAAKAGHGGTLDPLATGVLPIAFGEATKTVQYVMEGEKAYRFTVRWGEERDTDDAEGEVAATSDRRPTREEAETGKGAYVRALARDMGRELGCLGHIAALTRTRVGPFRLEDAISLEKLEELRHKDAGREALREVLLPVETALDDIPALAVDRNQATRIVRGQQVILRGGDAPVNEETVLATWKGKPVALCTVEAGILKPRRVFNLS